MTLTPLDQALKTAQDDEEARSAYYEKVLNTEFFVPTFEAKTTAKDATEMRATPLIAEHDGKDYLMLFDTMERMVSWAEGKVTGNLKLPGYMLVEFSTEDLHWALNTGCDYQRIFTPAEIGWLKKVVAQCKEIETIQNSGGKDA